MGNRHSVPFPDIPFANRIEGPIDEENNIFVYSVETWKDDEIQFIFDETSGNGKNWKIRRTKKKTLVSKDCKDNCKPFQDLYPEKICRPLRNSEEGFYEESGTIYVHNINEARNLQKTVKYLVNHNPIPPHIIERMKRSKIERSLKNAQDAAMNSVNASKNGLSKYPFIQEHSKMMKQEILFCAFIMVDKHPMLVVFTDIPEESDAVVTRIDLVWTVNTETKSKENTVRFQTKLWGDVANAKQEYRFDESNVHGLKKKLVDVCEFCKDYQEKNGHYDYLTNNCRKFMIELCGFVGISFPEKMAFEELWYKGAGVTASLKG